MAHIASDIERIGDLAKNVGKRVVAMDGQFAPQKIVGGVVHISDLALERLHRVLGAYAQRDVNAALDVWQHDEEIDQLYYDAVTPLQIYPDENKKWGDTLKIVYTSLHGTGITLIPKTLERWGFKNLSFVDITTKY